MTPAQMGSGYDRFHVTEMEPGGARALIKDLLAASADQVLVLDAAPESADALERSGFPCRVHGTRQGWLPPDVGSGMPGPASAWNRSATDWVQSALLRGAEPLRPDDKETAEQSDRYLHHGGAAWLRWNDRRARLEVTSNAAACPEPASCVAVLQGLARPVVVPDGQGDLISALGAAGFRFAGGHTDYLLQPCLTHSRTPVRTYPFTVTEQDVAEFGEWSGDLNPLHFDDGFAKALGFDGRIAHGMLFNGWLTRLLGTDYPGPGTVFLRSSSVFQAPVYAGRPYSVRVSTPQLDEKKGRRMVVAQLMDERGKHCVVAYNDVLHRPHAA